MSAPRLYVALCLKCDGLVGASVMSYEHAEQAAGFVATMILDGFAVISCPDRADYVKHTEKECECAAVDTYHSDMATDTCPKCDTPVWEAKKRNTCAKCGSRWSVEKALTIYRVTKHQAKAEGREVKV